MLLLLALETSGVTCWQHCCLLLLLLILWLRRFRVLLRADTLFQASHSPVLIQILALLLLLLPVTKLVSSKLKLSRPKI